jgi:uncharacterized lipoprotein YbaY
MINQTRWLALFLIAAGLSSGAPARAQVRFGGATSSNDLYNNMPAWSGSNWLGSNWLGNSQLPTQDWRLGVQVDNLDTGVFVRQVAPNSAASRANLEVNDVIVAVAGQQVGIVDGRPVDLGIEIKRRADSNGTVTLLVQDGSSGRLASIRVRLDGSQTSLRGQVVIRDRVQIPSDALVNVNIENLSHPNYVVRNGETTAYVNGQYTIPFEIAYDPTFIAAGDVYQLRARITSAGRVIFDTIQPVRVLGNNPTDNVQIAVAAIQPTNLANNSLPVIAAGYGGNDPLLAQYRQTYRRYLGRDPSDIEIAAFSVSPTASLDLEALPINLMASQQYYDAVGNNDNIWITSVFQKIIGRPPTPQESAQWLQYFGELRGSRVELLRQLVRSRR